LQPGGHLAHALEREAGRGELRLIAARMLDADHSTELRGIDTSLAIADSASPSGERASASRMSSVRPTARTEYIGPSEAAETVPESR
jgi:hypothetical protein